MKRYAKIAFALIPVYILIIAIFMGYPVFETSDDVYFIDVLSGRTTGSPLANISNINIILAYILQFLYKLKFFPWYPLLIVFSILAGNIAISISLWNILQNKSIGIISKAFCVIFIFPIIAYTSFLPTFTSAATLIAVLSIYLLYKKRLLASVLFLILSFLIRMYSGAVAFLFWGSLFINEYTLHNKKYNLVLFVAIVSLISLFLCNKCIRAEIETKDYKSFSKALAINYDYGKNWTQNQKIKAQSDTGFSDSMLELTISHYFAMDDRVNTTNLNKLNEFCSIKKPSVKNAIQHIKSAILKDLVVRHVIFTMLGAMLFILHCKKKIFLIFILAISAFLCLVLGFFERMIPRALFTIAYPYIIVFIIYYNKNAKPTAKVNSILAFVCIASLVFVSSTFIYKFNKSTYNLYIRKQNGIKREQLEDYCVNRSQNIYVYGGTLARDSRILLKNRPVHNIFIWGNQLTHSSVHNMQMKKAGLESFNVSEFTKPNVYLVLGTYSDGNFIEDINYAKLIENIMHEKNIQGEFQEVHRIDNVAVIKKFVKK